MQFNRLLIPGDMLCRTPAELLMSDLFKEVLGRFLSSLAERRSVLLELLKDIGLAECSGDGVAFDMEGIVDLLVLIQEGSLDAVTSRFPDLEEGTAERTRLYYLVEELYDYWRKLERFLVFKEDYRSRNVMTRDFHAWFRSSTQGFQGLVRRTYRRIAMNLTGTLFRVYRQLPSGVGAGLLVEKIPWEAPGDAYRKLESVPFIQLVIIEPPLIYYPKANIRSGLFTPVRTNPLEEIDISADDWFCFPAKVGLLKTFIYFHLDFLPLGASLANLFEIASDEEVLEGKPDCVMVFGAGGIKGTRATVYYEDAVNNTVVGLVSGGEDIDYFGYLKKMTLTLHNIIMINRNWFPVHGAMARITLKTGGSSNIIIVGDTGTGKSESLEAFRSLAEEHISGLEIVFDDMGVLGVDEGGNVRAYGTEIGAFVRLDDLEPGYAYSEVDRSIFMNPQLTNARVVIPISLYERVVRGYHVDLLLYANNYEEVDDEHPVIEFYDDVEAAMSVFESGSRMSKGTTDERGLVHSYFANPFGAVQKKEKHDEISRSFFERMLDSGTKIGQLRTRLGIKTREFAGPRAAAEAIFEFMKG